MGMTQMTCEEAQELVTGLIDGQLREPESAVLESHFKVCSKCRFALEQERNLKRAIFAAGTGLRAPAELKEALRNDPRLFAETVPARHRVKHSWFAPWRLPALGMAMVLLLVAAAWLLRTAPRSVALTAIEAYPQMLEAGAAQIASKDIKEVTDALAGMVQHRFRPMGYDFAMMQILPVGGTLRQFAGREVLITRYLGPEHSILCYTFLGDDTDAPASAALFHDAEKRLNFYAFSIGNVNAVLHRENDVICILASEMAMNELLELARAKAKPNNHL